MKHTTKFTSPFGSADALRLGMTGIELWMTAGTTIMLRYWSWAANWPYSNRQIRSENQRMINEKLTVGLEVNAQWWRAVLGMWTSTFNPWLTGQRLLTPLNRKTKANARRLSHHKNL
jgi:hypothetical protein